MKAELIDSMGSDLTVVNAARVSFDKESDWEPFDTEEIDGFKLEYGQILGQKDEKLIKYLASHNHWTPFAHPQITVRETVPIFVARQRFKHMVGFVYNEVSRRYVDDAPEFYFPDYWRGKPVDGAKQGSVNEPIRDQDLHDQNYQQLVSLCKNVYETMLEEGAAPEQARMVLPQSMYTSYYVTGSLAAWSRAYNQRIDPHAQKEIQKLAEQWGRIVGQLFPVSWKELTKNVS